MAIRAIPKMEATSVAVAMAMIAPSARPLIARIIAKKMEEIRTTTGIPLSKQIELKLKGYKIIKEENAV